MYRLTAIECVMNLAQVHSDADRDDIVFRHQVGDVIMFFLPGIVSGLQRIATDDEKQGHQITMVFSWVYSFELYTIWVQFLQFEPNYLSIKFDQYKYFL
jgi:hypothetical protein